MLECGLSRLSQHAQPGLHCPWLVRMTDSVVSADSLHSLYSDHRSWLHNWLRGKTGCGQDAADLVQDTFVRVIVSRNVAELREPRSYLVTVARGLMIDLFRRRALAQAYRDALAALPESLAPSPEEQTLMLEALLEIDAMFDGLGPRTKRIFILSQLEGLNYAQIADQLGISLRSVNYAMAKAMKHLCRLAP